MGLVLIVAISPPRSQPGESATNPLGYAFLQANSLAESYATSASNGPWRLVSAVGVAATQRFAPQISGVPTTGCQDLPGPTVWNGSRIPAWTGSLEAGITPFWQFLFVNGSGAILPIETVNETLAGGSPIRPTSVCGRALTTLDGTTPPRDLPTIQAPFDSSAAGQVAWANAGEQFFAAHHQGIAFYSMGPPPLYGVEFGPGWGVTYALCGLPGYAGDVAGASVGIVAASGPPAVSNNYTATCTFKTYNISFGVSARSPGPGGGEFLSLPLTLNVPYVNNSSETSSLATWLVSFNVTGASGVNQPVASVSCTAGVFAPSSCRPTSPGWFAALSTDAGYWLDLFDGSTPPSGWALPNVGVYTNDTLMVYLSPVLAGLTLTFSAVSNSSVVHISGSTPI